MRMRVSSAIVGVCLCSISSVVSIASVVVLSFCGLACIRVTTRVDVGGGGDKAAEETGDADGGGDSDGADVAGLFDLDAL